MSENLDLIWQALSEDLANWPDAAMGKMMSAPAVTRDGKVFAFYSTKGGMPGMGFRVGRDTDIAALDLKSWQHLAPFKTKPPMKDWIVVADASADQLLQLAQIAYDGLK